MLKHSARTLRWRSRRHVAALHNVRLHCKKIAPSLSNCVRQLRAHLDDQSVTLQLCLNTVRTNCDVNRGITLRLCSKTTRAHCGDDCAATLQLCSNSARTHCDEAVPKQSASRLHCASVFKQCAHIAMSIAPSRCSCAQTRYAHIAMTIAPHFAAMLKHCARTLRI